MALTRRILHTLADLPAAHLSFEQARCTRFRHRSGHCELCLAACPSAAIKLEQNGVSVEPSACLDCGACATTCPNQALKLHAPTTSELLKTALAGPRPHFACSRLLQEFPTNRCLEIECLAGLDEAILLTLAARPVPGADKDREKLPWGSPVRLFCADCEKCPLGAARQTIDAVLADCHELAPMAKISLQQGLPKELQMSARELKTQRRTDEGAAKRAAFSSVRREGPADLLTLLKESETGRQRRPAPDRYQKFRPLRQLQLRMDLKNLRHSTTSRLWGRLDIDLLKCTNCQICTKVCPTGALNAYHDNGAQGIDFAPYLCTNCRLCQDSCYPHAINIADGCDLEDLAEASLYRFELRPASPAPNSMHTNEANESSDLKADVCPVTERF